MPFENPFSSDQELAALYDAERTDNQNDSIFGNAVESGALGLRSGVQNTLAALGYSLGAQEFAARKRREAEKLSARAAGANFSAPKFSDIGSLGDVLDWSASTIGSNLPLLATLALTSGAGAVAGAATLGRAGLANAARKAAAERAATMFRGVGLSDEAATAAANTAAAQVRENALKRSLLSNAISQGLRQEVKPAKVGAFAGGYVPYFSSVSGENFARFMDDPTMEGTPEEKANAALLAGAAQAGLGTVVNPLNAFNYIRNQVGRKALNPLAAAGVVAAGEGATEMGELAIQDIAAKKFTDDNWSSASDYLEAGLGGALVGGTMAAPGAISAALQQRRDQPQPIQFRQPTNPAEAIKELNARDPLQRNADFYAERGYLRSVLAAEQVAQNAPAEDIVNTYKGVLNDLAELARTQPDRTTDPEGYSRWFTSFAQLSSIKSKLERHEAITPEVIAEGRGAGVITTPMPEGEQGPTGEDLAAILGTRQQEPASNWFNQLEEARRAQLQEQLRITPTTPAAEVQPSPTNEIPLLSAPQPQPEEAPPFELDGNPPNQSVIELGQDPAEPNPFQLTLDVDQLTSDEQARLATEVERSLGLIQEPPFELDGNPPQQIAEAEVVQPAIERNPDQLELDVSAIQQTYPQLASALQDRTATQSELNPSSPLSRREQDFRLTTEFRALADALDRVDEKAAPVMPSLDSRGEYEEGLSYDYEEGIPPLTDEDYATSYYAEEESGVPYNIGVEEEPAPTQDKYGAPTFSPEQRESVFAAYNEQDVQRNTNVAGMVAINNEEVANNLGLGLVVGRTSSGERYFNRPLFNKTSDITGMTEVFSSDAYKPALDGLGIDPKTLAEELFRGNLDVRSRGAFFNNFANNLEIYTSPAQALLNTLNKQQKQQLGLARSGEEELSVPSITFTPEADPEGRYVAGPSTTEGYSSIKDAQPKTTKYQDELLIPNDIADAIVSKALIFFNGLPIPRGRIISLISDSIKNNKPLNTRQLMAAARQANEQRRSDRPRTHVEVVPVRNAHGALTGEFDIQEVVSEDIEMRPTPLQSEFNVEVAKVKASGGGFEEGVRAVIEHMASKGYLVVGSMDNNFYFAKPADAFNFYRRMRILDNLHKDVNLLERAGVLLKKQSGHRSIVDISEFLDPKTTMTHDDSTHDGLMLRKAGQRLSQAVARQRMRDGTYLADKGMVRGLLGFFDFFVTPDNKLHLSEQPVAQGWETPSINTALQLGQKRSLSDIAESPRLIIDRMFPPAKQRGMRANMQQVLFSLKSPLAFLRRDRRRFDNPDPGAFLKGNFRLKMESGVPVGRMIYPDDVAKQTTELSASTSRGYTMSSEFVEVGQMAMLPTTFMDLSKEYFQQHGRHLRVGDTLMIHRDPSLSDGSSMANYTFAGIMQLDTGDVKSGIVVNPKDPLWKEAAGDFDGDAGVATLIDEFMQHAETLKEDPNLDFVKAKGANKKPARGLTKTEALALLNRQDIIFNGSTQEMWEAYIERVSEGREADSPIPELATLPRKLLAQAEGTNDVIISPNGKQYLIENDPINQEAVNKASGFSQEIGRIMALAQRASELGLDKKKVTIKYHDKNGDEKTTKVSINFALAKIGQASISAKKKAVWYEDANNAFTLIKKAIDRFTPTKIDPVTGEQIVRYWISGANPQPVYEKQPTFTSLFRTIFRAPVRRTVLDDGSVLISKRQAYADMIAEATDIVQHILKDTGAKHNTPAFQAAKQSVEERLRAAGYNGPELTTLGGFIRVWREYSRPLSNDERRDRELGRNTYEPSVGVTEEMYRYISNFVDQYKYKVTKKYNPTQIELALRAIAVGRVMQVTGALNEENAYPSVFKAGAKQLEGTGPINGPTLADKLKKEYMELTEKKRTVDPEVDEEVDKAYQEQIAELRRKAKALYDLGLISPDQFMLYGPPALLASTLSAAEFRAFVDAVRTNQRIPISMQIIGESSGEQLKSQDIPNGVYQVLDDGSYQQVLGVDPETGEFITSDVIIREKKPYILSEEAASRLDLNDFIRERASLSGFVFVSKPDGWQPKKGTQSVSVEFHAIPEDNFSRLIEQGENAFVEKPTGSKKEDFLSKSFSSEINRIRAAARNATPVVITAERIKKNPALAQLRVGSLVRFYRENESVLGRVANGPRNVQAQRRGNITIPAGTQWGILLEPETQTRPTLKQQLIYGREAEPVEPTKLEVPTEPAPQQETQTAPSVANWRQDGSFASTTVLPRIYKKINEFEQLNQLGGEEVQYIGGNFTEKQDFLTSEKGRDFLKENQQLFDYLHALIEKHRSALDDLGNNPYSEQLGEFASDARIALGFEFPQTTAYLQTQAAADEFNQQDLFNQEPRSNTSEQDNIQATLEGIALQPDVKARLQNAVDSLNILFGLRYNTTVLSAEEMIQKLGNNSEAAQKIRDYAEGKVGSSGMHYVDSRGNHYIYVSGKSNMTPEKQAAVMAHEWGHVIAEHGWNDLIVRDPSLARKVADAFNAYLGTHNFSKGMSRLSKELRTKIKEDPTILTSKSAQAQLSSELRTELNNVFHEWLADNIGAWVMTNKEPQSAVDNWFRQMSKAFIEFFRTVTRVMAAVFTGTYKKDQTLAPVASIEEWMKQLTDPAERLEKIYGAPDANTVSLADRAERRRLHLKSYMTGAYPNIAQLNTIVQEVENNLDLILTPADANLLRRSAIAPALRQRMATLLRGDTEDSAKALERIQTSADAAAAYLYVLSATGLLRTSGETYGALSRLHDALNTWNRGVAEITNEEADTLLKRFNAVGVDVQTDNVIPRNSPAARLYKERADRYASGLVGAVQRGTTAYHSVLGWYLDEPYQRLLNTQNPVLINDLGNRTHPAAYELGGLKRAGAHSRGQVTAQIYFNRVHEILQKLDENEVQDLYDLMYKAKTEGQVSAKVKTANGQMRALLDNIYQYEKANGVFQDATVVNEETGEKVPRETYRKDYVPFVPNHDFIKDNKAYVMRVYMNPAFTKGWEDVKESYIDWLGKALKESGVEQAKIETAQDEIRAKTLEQFVELYLEEDSNRTLPGTKIKALENEKVHTPSHRFINPRILNFLLEQHQANPQLHRQVLETLNTNVAEVVSSYIRKASKRTEWQKLINDLGGLEDFWAKVRRAASNPKDAERDVQAGVLYLDNFVSLLGIKERDFVDRVADAISKDPDSWVQKNIHSGGHKILNPTVQNAQAWVITMLNISHLTLAAASSSVDPLGAFVRSGGNFKDYSAAFNDTYQALRASVKKLPPEGLGILLDSVGTMERLLSREDIIATYYSEYFGTTQSAIMDKFFRYNGVESITKFARALSTMVAFHSIRRWKAEAEAGSAEALKELRQLGLTPQDVLIDSTTGHIKLLNWDEREAGGPAEQERDLRLRAAVHSFVDQSTVRPDQMGGAYWMQNPYAAIPSLWKKFSVSFHANILKPVYSRALEDKNYVPLATMVASFVPLMIFADWIRDMAKEAFDGDDDDDELSFYDQRPQWKNGWTLSDHIAYAVTRSGFLGNAELAKDILDPLLEGDVAKAAAAVGGVGASDALRVSRYGMSSMPYPGKDLVDSWKFPGVDSKPNWE